MRFEANKAMYVIVVILLAVLCLCVPTKIIVESPPVAIEVVPSEVILLNDNAILLNNQEIIKELLNKEYEQRYTEELIKIIFETREYPWIVQVINGEHQIFPEYQGNGIWLVTVKFQSFSKQYIFDEVQLTGNTG